MYIYMDNTTHFFTGFEDITPEGIITAITSDITEDFQVMTVV